MICYTEYAPAVCAKAIQMMKTYFAGFETRRRRSLLLMEEKWKLPEVKVQRLAGQLPAVALPLPDLTLQMPERIF